MLKSLLDTDFYKLAMQQAYFHQKSELHSRWQFKSRGGDDLAHILPALKAAVAELESISLTLDEQRYLKSTGVFQEDYLAFLKSFRFKSEYVHCSLKNNELHLAVEGPLLEATLYEVPLLSMICELYNKQRYPYTGEKIFTDVIKNKINGLKRKLIESDQSTFAFQEFGTRRRFSQRAQEILIELLSEHLPQVFKGTSNIHLAKKYQLPCVGTMGHEWLQVYQALDGPLIDSQKRALSAWLEHYGVHLSVALTDIIGIDAFCHDLDANLAHRYQGFRHDSGSAIEFGEKILARLKALNIEAKDKTLVFSDGLNFSKAYQIHEHFRGRIKVCFGIGTWLSGNMVVNRPLNIVLKLVALNDKPVAKISDSFGKSMCEDYGFLQQLMAIFAVDSKRQESILGHLA